MKTLLKWIGALVGVLVLVGAGLAGLSELGEVVVLETRDADGKPRETRLWIVEDGGHEWLRGGQSGSGWLQNLRANPEVTLTRGGEPRRYRAVPLDDPAARDRVNTLMAEKYGLPDRIIDALFRDPTQATAIRLDPLESP